jgi:glycerophosphoryl diester phosphodiesterase
MKFINYFEPNPVVLAHRGDSKFFPENTMPAFESAYDLGVDVIETDVHITADNEVVIWHDSSLDRVSDKQGEISSYTYQELLEIDPGYFFSNDNGKSFPWRGKGLKIVKFSELLETLPDMRFNVDLKDKSTDLVYKVAEILNVYSSFHRVCLGSFHSGNIELMRKIAPEAITAFTPGEIKKYVIEFYTGLFFFRRKFKGSSFMIPEYEGKHKLVSKRFLKAVHARGLYVHVWTVNEREDMKRLLEMGVDGLFTDDPRLLQEVVKKS